MNRRTFAIVAGVIAALLLLAIVTGGIANAQSISSAINDAAQNNALEILDLLIKVVLFVLSLILTFAMSKLPPKWRREAENALLAAEAKMRDALHEAARTGVLEGQRQGLTGVALVNFALAHMVKSVPDTIAGLTPTPAEILQGAPDLVIRQLPDGVRSVLERIIGSKIADPLTNALRDAGAPVRP